MGTLLVLVGAVAFGWVRMRVLRSRAYAACKERAWGALFWLHMIHEALRSLFFTPRGRVRRRRDIESHMTERAREYLYVLATFSEHLDTRRIK